MTAPPLGGYWIEAVVRDTDAWYGFYHNELEGFVCAGSGKVLPRIGAARSDRVGVSVARLAWADRDAPRGRVDIWSDGVWLPPTLVPALPEAGTEDDDAPDAPEAPEAPTPDDGQPAAWIQPLASPIFPAAHRWDDPTSLVDVFWGPSIHWNAHLESYVMLLNQAVSNEWRQGGVFVSYNPRLDDPAGWTTPTRLFSGGQWYPQVIGLDEGQGTDAYAGATARFFMGGRSDYAIRFGRR